MDYKNGKIYAIRSHQIDEIYIGSTTQTLTKRLSAHKNKDNKCKSKQILQYDDAYIELIELFPCNSKEELNKKEGEHIRTNNCVNKQIAGRTLKEYLETNKEKIKEYREEHKEKMKEYMKEYREEHKEQIKEQIKEYREEHKEQKKEYMREYRLKKKSMNEP